MFPAVLSYCHMVFVHYLILSYSITFFLRYLVLPFHTLFFSIYIVLSFFLHAYIFFTYHKGFLPKSWSPFNLAVAVVLVYLHLPCWLPHQVWLNQGFSRQPMRAGRRRGFRPSHRESEGHVYRAVLHRVDEKPLGTPGGHKYRNDVFFLQPQGCEKCGMWSLQGTQGY